MKWHEMSVNDKESMLLDAWHELKLKHLHIDFIFESSEIPFHAPVNRDGNIIIVIYHMGENIRATSSISFRSLTYSSPGYAKHVIKTLAHDVAKQYFGLKE